MILDDIVNIKINNYCIKHYRELGYIVKEYDLINIPVYHLLPTSHQMINVKCDVCGKEKKIQYRRYLLSFNNRGYYSCSDCQKIKMNEIIKEKYNCENVFQNEKIKNKIKKTNFQKYGNESFLRYRSREVVINKYSNLNMIDVDYDKNEYILKCERCGGTYRINKKIFITRLNKYKTIICTICNPINRHVSGKEIQLQDFIKKNYTDEIIFNSRKIIHPLELDIFLPKLNIAFEFNGTYWHRKDIRTDEYHINKIEKCKDLNIELMNIWEKEWTDNRKIVEQLILSVINQRLMMVN